jgi:hypothetical protein
VASKNVFTIATATPDKLRENKRKRREMVKKAEKIAGKEDVPAPAGGFDYYLGLAKESEQPKGKKAPKSLAAFLDDEDGDEPLDFDALTREIKGE